MSPSLVTILMTLAGHAGATVENPGDPGGYVGLGKYRDYTCAQLTKKLAKFSREQSRLANQRVIALRTRRPTPTR